MEFRRPLFAVSVVAASAGIVGCGVGSPATRTGASTPAGAITPTTSSGISVARAVATATTVAPSTGSTSNLTPSEQQAVDSAKQYLQTSPFSKQGLINQLDSSAGDGFSTHDATVAVNSLSVNWNAEAAADAKQYLQTSSFSCQALVQQLSSSAGSQFTAAQARYGAVRSGICGSGSTPASTSNGSASSTSGLSASETQAVDSAKQYLQVSAFSRQGLIDQLDSAAGAQFSVNDATVAVDSLRVNWNTQAARAAKQYLQTSPFSCQALIQQLSSSAGSQFTFAQAQYGAARAGICSTDAAPATTPATPQPKQGTGGPLAALRSYWADINDKEFGAAFAYLASQAGQSESQFIAGERQAGVLSAAFNGRVESETRANATVDVQSLITHDREFGCRSWTGSYQMIETSGQWQIEKAVISPTACR